MLIVRALSALHRTAPTPPAGECAAPDPAGTDVILACQCRPATPGPVDERLCIKLMRTGSEEHRLLRRELTLDEDAYLILNRCAPGCSVYRAETVAQPLAVFFDPRTLAQSRRHALTDEPAQPAAAPMRFLEHLRPHGDEVSALLRRIARAVDAGIDDALWFDERVVELLQAALRREAQLHDAAHRIDSVKPATRQELWRRVMLAADFIWSNYEQPISLADIAGAARLSRFHLVRLFRQVHGVTPHEHLMAKRLVVAERLLSHTSLDLNEVAMRAGFGTRSSLFRQLRKHRGTSGEGLRRRGAPATPRTLPPCRTSA